MFDFANERTISHDFQLLFSKSYFKKVKVNEVQMTPMC